MKILFNASMYSEKPAGVGVYIRQIWNQLCKQLDQKANKCYFYSYSSTEIKKVNSWRKIKLPLVLESIFKRFLSVHRLLWNIFYLPVIAKHFDIVYSFSSHGSPFIKNQIITIHDLICFSFPKQHGFQYLYFKYILPHIIKACKKIVVISEFTKQEVIKYYKVNPEKIEVIFNGGNHFFNETTYTEEDAKTLQNAIDGRFYLTVGASYAHKNVERLLLAMQQSGIKDKLVIVGSVNKYYKYLQSVTSENKISNVVFLPYVSSASLSWLYSNCIANVYVSLYEGFGFPPLEAAMNNKISILSNTSALQEIYKDAAVFVDPTNVTDLSNALKLVTSCNFDYNSYLSKVRSLINKYTWKTAANKVACLLAECK